MATMEGETCPPAYETFIDMIRPSNVKYVVWFFFDKLKAVKLQNVEIVMKKFHMEMILLC